MGAHYNPAHEFPNRPPSRPDRRHDAAGSRRFGRQPRAVRRLDALRRALYPQVPQQHVRRGVRWRGGTARAAERARVGHRAVAGDGHPDRAGARLAAAGRGAAEPARRRVGVLARAAHHRCARTRIGEGGGRRGAAGHRGCDQPGAAELADGACAHQRRVRQLRDRTAGGDSRRRGLRAHRHRAQDRRRVDPSFAREPQARAAVAAGFSPTARRSTCRWKTSRRPPRSRCAPTRSSS